jgi:hypothetical protein
MLTQDQVNAIEGVLATVNGNSYGLTEGERLRAVQMACQELALQFPKVAEFVRIKYGHDE